ncbi:unnamed protein product, partial [Ectocarpus fasciculatus]
MHRRHRFHIFPAAPSAPSPYITSAAWHTLDRRMHAIPAFCVASTAGGRWHCEATDRFFKRVVKATLPMRRKKQHNMHAATARCPVTTSFSAIICIQVVLLFWHGTLLVQGVSPSLRASHHLRSRSLQTSTCSLEVEQEVWANLSINSG